MQIPFLGLDLLYPRNLLWVVPGVLLLILFARGGFISLRGDKGSVHRRFVTRLRSFAPSLLLFLALCALGLGLADLGGGVTRVSSVESTSRIVVTQDQSGSMYNGWSSALTCMFRGDEDIVARFPEFDLTGESPTSVGDPLIDRDLKRAWRKQQSMLALPNNPRIEGSCMALEALLDGLEERALRTDGSVRHHVAFLRFADKSILQEPFTTDYSHLRALISEHDWRASENYQDVGSGTSLNVALFDMLLVALRRHMDAEAGVTPIPEAVTNVLFGRVLTDPRDSGEIESVIALYPDLFGKLREELADTSLVVITDATDGASRWNQSPSLAKMLRLARALSVSVYVISTEEDDAEFRAALEATGTPDRPGGFFLTNKVDGYGSMRDDMRTILDRAFVRMHERVETKRNSYAEYCFGIALLFLCLAYFVKEGPLGRSLTG